jgi:hypothetical protein
MRHDPPWQNRPWVLTAEGRQRFIGTGIRCTQCETAVRTMFTEPLMTSRSPATMSVEFDATHDDMGAFQAFVTAGIRKAVRTPAYYQALAILIAFVAISLSGMIDFTLHPPTVAVVLILFGIFWLIISRMYKRAASPFEKGSLVGQRTIVIDDEGVRQIAPLHEGHTKWPGVLSVNETGTHVFLMTDRLAGYIVPRRAFADEAQYTAFVAFARERVRR